MTDNAKRAATASDKARHVSQNATEGGAVMHVATQAMAAIETTSDKISNIIGLIDDIAFQTNLLALNASVEAARAGVAAPERHARRQWLSLRKTSRRQGAPISVPGRGASV